MGDAANRDLLTDLARWPDVVEAAGEQLEPHQVTTYLLELAQAFQSYYNDHQFLVDDAGTRDARLALALAVRQVLAHGLDLDRNSTRLNSSHSCASRMPSFALNKRKPPKTTRPEKLLPDTTPFRSASHDRPHHPTAGRDVGDASGEQLEQQQVTKDLLELAQAFQTYYSDHQFLVDDAGTREARLALALAVRQVLANGLELVGVHAPEKM